MGVAVLVHVDDVMRETPVMEEREAFSAVEGNANGRNLAEVVEFRCRRRL